jgi:predicted lipopolysaccharide heptosyltransferase III
LTILLVRLREIGDVVFTTPAVRAIRSHFPDARLTYIVEPLAAAVLQHNPDIDELLTVPRGRGPSGLVSDIALALRLRARHYDLAIDFHGGPRASLLTWLSGARRRIGYEVSARAWMYTDRVARSRELRARHSVENQWDLLAPLGIDPPDRVSYPVTMCADAAAVARVDERLRRAGLARDDRIVVLHVSAGNPFRRWPLDRFVAVARALGAVKGRRVIVTSGPSERDAAAEVIAQSGAMACGEFSLPELRALLDRAALYIGGDSGPLHIAATTRVPIVGLYGPTLPARSAPWRDPRLAVASIDAGALPCRPCDQRVCAPGDFRCLTGIDAATVIAAAERLLIPTALD